MMIKMRLADQAAIAKMDAMPEEFKHPERENDPAASGLPIVPVRRVRLSDGDRSGVARLAQTILSEHPKLSNLAYFGAGVKSGFGPAPRILIGDKSEIPLLAPAGQDTLEYRIALLADEDDLIVVAAERNTAFEAYLGNLSGKALDVTTVRQTDDGPPLPTARRCMADQALMKHLTNRVRANNGATLLPHISTGSIWALAKDLHERTQEPVFVAGPPPSLSNRVNDKLWFGDLVTRLFGETAIPPKHSAFGPAALTGHVHRLAQKWEKIVVKVPDSAGSAGNFPILSATVRALGARALQKYLLGLMSAAGWSDIYPLMVEVWDCNVLSSPSVQIWIPERDDGDPIIEGVFDQILMGEEGRFVGAAPAGLAQSWDHRLCRDAMKLALLLQHIGYFGRCSFDTVIAGEDYDNANLHWIECNGRWGGVSLPMTFINRLFSPALPAFVIVQRSDLDFQPLPFEDALHRLGDCLYRPDGDPVGAILITPGGIEAGTSVHMIAMDQTIEKAMQRAGQVIKSLGNRTGL